MYASAPLCLVDLKILYESGMCPLLSALFYASIEKLDG